MAKAKNAPASIKEAADKAVETFTYSGLPPVRVDASYDPKRFPIDPNKPGVPDQRFNPRKQTDAFSGMGWEMLLEDTAKGIRDYITVVEQYVKPDGTVEVGPFVLKGSRRTAAALHHNLPGIPAMIYDELTEAQAHDLANDHGSAQRLDEVSVFFAIRDLKRSIPTIKEADIGVRMFESLNALDPLNAKKIEEIGDYRTKDGKERLRNVFRGRLQATMAVLKLPDFVQEAYVEQLQGAKNWGLTKKNLMTMASKFEEAATGVYGLDNPPPEFIEMWKPYEAAAKEADESGSTKGPTVKSMLTRKDCEDLLPRVPALLKPMLLYVLQKAPMQDQTGKWAEYEVLVRSVANKLDAAETLKLGILCGGTPVSQADMDALKAAGAQPSTAPAEAPTPSEQKPEQEAAKTEAA